MLNAFAHLSAESAESRLAHVASHEATIDQSSTLECVIVKDDVGDDDCAKPVYDVWVAGQVLHCARTLFDACRWANANGLRIVQELPF